MRASHRISIGLLAAILAPLQLAAQAGRSVEGRVLALRDSLPLAGVVIRVLEHPHSAVSGPDGRFVLVNLPAAPLRVTFRRIGVTPDTVTLSPSLTALVVYLRARPVVLPAVTGVGQTSARERFERVAQTSTVALEPVELKQLPGLAEPDVARAVQLLPGTVAKHDFSTGLNVRGGENDQNLIRLDGIPVFNPTHLGGLFSTFEPEAVQSVEFITGGFPAGYGGRLSSVLDVSLRDGAPDLRARGALSLLSAKLLLEGPVPGSPATYLVGARRTYADALADNFSDDPFAYYFLDGMAKVTVPFRGGASWSATGYWGRDHLDIPWIEPSEEDLGVDLQLRWGNRLAGTTLRLPLGAVVLEQHASVSEFATRQAFVPDVSSFDNSARVWSLRTALGAALGTRHQLRLGAGWEHYRMWYQTRDDALDQDLTTLRYEPHVWSAFLDEQWQPIDALLLRPGVRVEHVTGAGVTTVAPRVALKVFVARNLALTGSAGRYYQAIQSLSDQELAFNVFDVWIGAHAQVPVARSEHAVLGVERWFGQQTSIAVEGYVKTFDGLVIRNQADDPGRTGDEFVPASGEAKGVDVLIRRHAARVRGWLAYSYTWAERRTAADTFPPGHDRRHSVDLVLEAPGPLGSRLGARWGYGSPLPYSGIEGAWLHRDYNPILNAYDAFQAEPVSTRVNNQRYPHYSRLDISLRWEFTKWGAVWRPYVQVVNAYNRRNVFVYRFDYRATPPTRTGLTQLPLLPTLGVEFEF